MNRLRILKQRIRRAGDVGIHKFADGYFLATGRFQGDCIGPLTKRQAIQIGARWAMPNRPQPFIVTQGNVETTYQRNSRGEQTVTVRHLDKQ